MHEAKTQTFDLSTISWFSWGVVKVLKLGRDSEKQPQFRVGGYFLASLYCNLEPGKSKEYDAEIKRLVEDYRDRAQAGLVDPDSEALVRPRLYWLRSY